jgi:hypothetical protein
VRRSGQNARRPLIRRLTRLHEAFLELHAGYRAFKFAVEALSLEDDALAQATGVWRRKNGPGLPALYILDRESSLSIAGSIANWLFQSRELVMRFPASIRGVLKLALLGMTDAEIAAELSISLAAVKKRWVSAFDRATSEAGNLFSEEPDGRHGTRGRQKRHRLLACMRARPEELRPFSRTPSERGE